MLFIKSGLDECSLSQEFERGAQMLQGVLMFTAQTAQERIVGSTGCDDRSRLSIEEQNVDRKANEADASMAEKVERALWNNGVLRNTDYGEIDVLVNDGVVTLRGHVINTTNQQGAAEAARTIPGVVEVKSYLVPDDKITLEVARALGEIERDHGVKFFTGARNGVVVLTGEAGSAEVRSMAEKYAANVPGVRCVINSVQAPGVDLQAEEKRFLQPSIGEPIYFRDGLFGKVRKVIINPNNRRVIAMLLPARYSNSHPDSRSPAYEGGQSPEHLIVVPVSDIRHLTRNSGFLETNSSEAAKYADFDPARFVSPGEEWTPPYPYCPNEVLFPAETSKKS